jgi:hypothetical protein
VTSAGVDEDALVRTFLFTLLSFVAESLSFRPIHSQEMIAADAALSALGGRDVA